MNKHTAALLEQHFDTAFNAPNGIQKLRELILTLAMQGKLVPQEPNDTPASELLKEIEAEKKRLVKEGKIKTPKPLPPVTEEEKPYELPQGWEWVRLGEIGIWKSGSTPSRTNSSYYGGEIPWVKSGEVKQGRIKHTEETITEQALNQCSLSLNPKGAVLVAMYGANIGEVGILDIEATTNQAVCACTTFTAFDERYLLNLIVSLKPYFISQGAGAAQPNISREKIIATPFPLPPLKEQHRIVAKIDELMACCDALEKLRTAQNEKRLTVHAAAMGQLLNIAEPTQHQRAQAFLAEHFGDLYTVKANVAELRKAILQLAVMGKLVPQNPNDPPASELLRDIEAAKKRLVKEGKIKTPKPLPPVAEDEKPYALPQGWEWVSFQSLPSDYSVGLDRGRGQQSTESCGKFRYFKMNNILNGGGFNLTDMVYVEATHEEVERFSLNDGDLLFNTRNSRELVGKACVFENDSDEPVLYNNNILRAIFTHRTIAEFLALWFGSITGKVELEKIKSGTTNVWAIYQGKLEQLLCPLPPLEEQHRIVEKIDQLMALCDSLDQQIDAATDKQNKMLDAVMAQI